MTATITDVFLDIVEQINMDDSRMCDAPRYEQCHREARWHVSGPCRHFSLACDHHKAIMEQELSQIILLICKDCRTEFTVADLRFVPV